MDMVVVLNAGLGLLLAGASLYYCKTLGYKTNWRVTGAIVVGFWIAFVYLARLFLVPDVISHGVWGVWLVRPAFTFILILMTAKAVASAKRVKYYGSI